MSEGRYGWLTESSIISKKSKPIAVGDSGLVDLQAAILATKNKQRQIKKQPHKPKKNQGIQQRNKKDLVQNEKESLSGMVKDSYNSLLRKQKVYDTLQKNIKNHDSFLVDFVEKKLTDNDDQYVKNRQEFYEGKLDVLKRQRDDLHQNSVYVSQIEDEARQRLAWEKKIFSELKDGKSQIKQKVAQSFDKKLSQQQKQALATIIHQRQMEKIKLEQMRKMRKQVEQDRIRKLRKLNIISSQQNRQQKQKEQKLIYVRQEQQGQAIKQEQIDQPKREQQAKKNKKQ